MNCCNDFGRCNCGNGVCAPIKASRPATLCDERMVCQSLSPRCPGCTSGLQLTQAGIRLAPGVVEGYKAPFLGSPAQRRELVRQAKRAAVWVVILTLVAFAAGLSAGGF